MKFFLLDSYSSLERFFPTLLIALDSNSFHSMKKVKKTHILKKLDHFFKQQSQFLNK